MNSLFPKPTKPNVYQKNELKSYLSHLSKIPIFIKLSVLWSKNYILYYFILDSLKYINFPHLIQG